jgi:hypothetical protein
MHRRELDQTRLAIALTVTAGGQHTSVKRRTAFADAQAVRAALEDAEITEASMAMAMHGAWCSGTRSGSFHPWTTHIEYAANVLDALGDPALDAQLVALADDTDPDRHLA